MDTEWITGAPVSSVTVRVTVVLFPAASVATTVMVFAPAARVSCFVKEPFSATATYSAAPLFSLTVTVTGLDVASFVVPDTVHEELFVTESSAGAVTESVGGMVSTLKVTVFCVAALPSLSEASTFIVC